MTSEAEHGLSGYDAVCLSVEGRPFYVRVDKVLAVGTQVSQEVNVDESSKPVQVAESTIISVEGLGNIPVDGDPAFIAKRLWG